MKKLVIAEKPSVAVTIAKAIGVPVGDTKKGYFEGDNFVVTFCFGHLIGLDDPESYGDRYKTWSRQNLPIFPQKWNYKIGKNCDTQFNIIKKLMFRKDVSSLVCATDAGREGESIFRMTYFYAGCNKPFERLWVSSMEESAIRDGFNHLQPSSKYDGLYRAAIARLRADWLVGMNCTRFYTSEAWNGKGPLSVGRVQTPTLNMIVERQAEIDNFKVTKQWAVKKDFGPYDLETENFRDENQVQDCFSRTNNAPVVISELQKKPNRKENPPKLFDLTALQKEANKRYGMSAQVTLDNLQALYERKYVTYPRTDSCHITSADVPATKTLMQNLAHILCNSVNVPENLDFLVGDVTDHGALLVTPTFLENIRTAQFKNDYEKNILRLIMCRMLCSISPARIFEETKVTGLCEGYAFSGSGTKDIELGWKAVEKYLLGKDDIKEDDKDKSGKKRNVFPADLQESKTVYSNSTEIMVRDTKPPKAYTEAELLALMEKAGKEDFSEDVERRGLGTAATRAAIIENLLQKGMIERRKGKTEKSLERLYPLDKGKYLISIVDPSLKSVSLTAAWEERLSFIRDGKENFNRFCQDIEKDIEKVLDEPVKHSTVSTNSATQNKVFTASPKNVQPQAFVGNDYQDIDF